MITPADIAGARTRLGEGFVDPTGVLWVASPPEAMGRTSLYALVEGTVRDVTPEWDLRGSIHDYGGTAVGVHNGHVVFFDRITKRVWAGLCHSTQCEFRPITPEGPWRWGGFEFLDETHVVCVREDCSPDLPEAQDALVILDLDTDNPKGGEVIAQGADFYWTPTVNTQGDIAWMEYDHPNMGWTHTRIAIRTASGQTSVIWDEPGVSACWPQWDTDGSVVFLADESGYWTFHRWRRGEVRRLHDHPYDFCEAPWVLARPPYSLLNDDVIGCVWWADGLAHVGKLASDGSLVELLVTASATLGPSGCLPSPNALDSTEFPTPHLCVATLSWADQPRGLYVLDWEDGSYQPLVREYETLSPIDDRSELSHPELLQWKAETGEDVHAWFYPAITSDDSHTIPTDSNPPLLVLSHSGPTNQTTSTFSLVIQYFAAHGIGVLDVNYSGSTGRGRAYRDRLMGQWGVVDVRDCVEGAQEIVRRGLADPLRVAIMGSSAGGFTTLAALTSSDVFKAGISMYGIADLEALTRDTIKFESHYNDWLIGPYLKRTDLFWDRSPIHHLDTLNAPMLILQGEDDPVVPPSQAREMYNAVLAKGLDADLVMYPGEGHGFRQPDTIQDAYTRIVDFLTRVFEL